MKTILYLTLKLVTLEATGITDTTTWPLLTKPLNSTKLLFHKNSKRPTSTHKIETFLLVVLLKKRVLKVKYCIY